MKNKDGSLKGTWDEEMGEHTISDISYKDGTLRFTRQSSFDEFDLETSYEGTIKEHVLTGALENDMGHWPANGKRVGAPLIGTWEFENTSQWGPPKRQLIIFPDMSGRYQWFDGLIPIKDLTLKDDQVTFIIESGFGDRTFTMEFKGKLAEDALQGEMISERGTRPANGKKVKEKKVEATTEKSKEASTKE
jgi:hypothetical protein